ASGTPLAPAGPPAARKIAEIVAAIAQGGGKEEEMTRRSSRAWLVGMSVLWVLTVGLAVGRARLDDRDHERDKHKNQDFLQNAAEKAKRGRQIFRFDTFGDQAFWGDTLKLHQAIAGARFGGVGPGVSP